MKLLIIDAFAEQTFSGNPAAVCIAERQLDEQWMQQLAAEMNLSETAFIRRSGSGYELRWFTPTIEVELCGHATLASAHALWWENEISESTISFETRSGILTATRAGQLIELDFPATPPAPAEAPQKLLEALGIENPEYVAKSKFDRFLVVESEDILRSIKPDFPRLGQVEMRGVIVTSRSADIRFDFISRYFAPAAGIDEDPVTGSAHCCLAPFWAERLNKDAMVGFQASPRGGVVQVTVCGDRVKLAGKAVSVVRGEVII